VVVEEKGRISRFAAFKRLFSGGVARKPNGPTQMDFAAWAKAGKTLKRHRCKVCGVYFWSWRKQDCCYKWSCYKR